MFRVIWFALLFALMGQPLFAQEDGCGPRALQIMQVLYSDAESLGDGEYAVEGGRVRLARGGSVHPGQLVMICRQWPAYPGHLLVAVPVMHVLEGPDAPYTQEGDLDLVVMNHETLEIQAREVFSDFLFGDAVALTGMSFDTAYYDVFGHGPAFGLRLDYRTSSRPNPYAHQALWLFDYGPDGPRPILENLIVWQQGGEWDATCEGEFYELSRVLQISEARHNGAADIVVKTDAEQSTNDEVDGECVRTEFTSQDPARPISLEYDGEAYALPEEMQGW
ncbi:hypothetical protein [Paracoccus albus]|uniref:hypothetical protein n=1 Tax=Paracoccus albus TaxID=3017784 RepID=UPI0022F027A9|nr:hypothetical protein [Paracoccus albus]WBU60263.1 hypothetical protein PAF20_16230 [Paracoccus albus]